MALFPHSGSPISTSFGGVDGGLIVGLNPCDLSGLTVVDESAELTLDMVVRYDTLLALVSVRRITLTESVSGLAGAGRAGASDEPR